MLRGESAGRHKVSFALIAEVDDNGRDVHEDMRVPLGPHTSIWKDTRTETLLESPEQPSDFALSSDKPASWVLVEEAPTVSIKSPYTGELSTAELAYLNGLPGRDYSAHYRFTVEKA